MKSLAYTQRIDAPPSIVFRLLEDADLLQLWMEGVEHVIFEDGEKQVGMRFTQHIREGRHLHVYEGEIIAYDPPRRYEVRLGNDAFRMHVCYELTATDAGTELRYRAEMEEANWFVDLMAALFSTLTRKLLHRHMTNLKQLAESGDYSRSPAWT